MLSVTASISRALTLLLVCTGFLLLPAHLRAQEQTRPAPPDEAEDVVRISTELVQTDVMVFDKQGRFVDGLKPEQFELKVDGKPQPFSFFERIKAGSVDEDAQLAAARGGATRRASASASGAAIPLDRGRTVFFFVDDLHLSPENVTRARRTLQRFVDEEMGQNDVAVIASASGQIGFLQQLTSEKAVLRAAIARLMPRGYTIRELDQPPMTESHALAIEHNDNQVIEYFVDALLRENPRMGREAAAQMVGARARNIMRQSTSVSTSTLFSLENTLRSSAPLPGRKIIFFISEGFLLDLHDGYIRDRLRRVTDAAARAGAVIYSMDARGLATGLPDASTQAAFDPAGRLAAVDARSLNDYQEPLHTIAVETGGRAMLNTNALNVAVKRTLEETSLYYLLAWRPSEADARGGSSKFRRIEVSIRERPDLSVVVRRGFYDMPPPPDQLLAKAAKDEKKAKEEKHAVEAQPIKLEDRELLSALKSLYPRTELPTLIALGYVNTPAYGMVLTVSAELLRESLGSLFTTTKEPAKVDIAGAVFDERGQIASSFRQELSITPPAQAASPTPAMYSYQFHLKPGLYQARVAVRDRRSGRMGSAMQWVEIPEFKAGQLSMSSLFIGERTTAEPTQALKDETLSQGVLLSVERRFARTSWLRFITFIYNPVSRAEQPADVALQVQIFRDDQPVITSPLTKISTQNIADQSRIPYAAEVSLASLPTGRYVLQVTAIDRTAKQSTSRRVNFSIE